MRVAILRELRGRWSAPLIAHLQSVSNKSLIPSTVMLAFACFMAGWLGVKYAVGSEIAPAVWAPTGIALAGLLVLGYQVWPGIFVGSLLVLLTTAVSFAPSFAIAAGNTVEALVAAYLVNRLAHGRQAFDRHQDVLRYTLVAAGVCCLGATVGQPISSMALANWSSAEGFSWLTWWLGHVSAALIIAPAFVLWSNRSHERADRRRVWEECLLLTAVVVTGLALFGGLVPFPAQHSMRIPIDFLTLPVVIWAAFRFGPRHTATAILALSLLAVWGTIRGDGPFALSSPINALLVLQGYMSVTAVVTLALAAAIQDQRRAHERIRVLEEEERRREQRRADDAEAVRDQLREFMGMVVHDLRNPLTVTAGYTQLLRRQLATPDASDPGPVLDKIDGSVQTMRRLVADLLDSTRLGAGRFVVTPVPTDLVPTLRRVVDEQEDGDHRQRLVVHTPIQLTGVWDADRLGQVLTNLLSNARKYSPVDAPIEVTVWHDADTVQLSVADQGPGIATDQRAHLFEPFARLGQERQATGTGLGLYITKGIVEAHGGRIWVESEPGRGSTFHVELPRQQPPAQAMSGRAQTAA